MARSPVFSSLTSYSVSRVLAAYGFYNERTRCPGLGRVFQLCIGGLKDWRGCANELTELLELC